MFLEECSEQRGRCASFMTPKQYRKRVREQLERINQSQKSAGAAASANEAGMDETGD